MLPISVFGGAPGCFRARCFEASQQRYGQDYSDAGYLLATIVSDLIPDDASDEQWESEVSSLNSLLESDKAHAVLEWFLDHFPKCLAIVPSRRRASFIRGVFRYWLHEECGLDLDEADEQAAEILDAAAAVDRLSVSPNVARTRGPLSNLEA